MSPTSRNHNAIANLRRKESLLYRIITRLNKMIDQQKNLKVLLRMKNRYLNKVHHVQNCLALELKLFKMNTDKQSIMSNERLKQELTNKVMDFTDFLDNHLMNENDTFQESSCKSFIYDSVRQLQERVNSVIPVGAQ